MSFVTGEELIHPELWARSLTEVADHRLTYGEMTSMVDTVDPRLWVRVKYLIGPFWYGKSVNDFHSTGLSKYEFAVNPPIENRVEMDHWLDLTQFS